MGTERADIVSQIVRIAGSQERSLRLPPATPSAVDQAERSLGFPIPPLLKDVYLRAGNGGFGPGRGGTIIGVDGGYASDLGTLVGTTQEIRDGAAAQAAPWPPAMLPFCEWGCNIFSCVDCGNAAGPVYLAEA